VSAVALAGILISRGLARGLLGWGLCGSLPGGLFRGQGSGFFSGTTFSLDSLHLSQQPGRH